MLESGLVSGTDFGWSEGSESWQPISELLNAMSLGATVRRPSGINSHPGFSEVILPERDAAPEYGSFLRRLGAGIIDYFLLYWAAMLAISFHRLFIVGSSARSGSDDDAIFSLLLLGGWFYFAQMESSQWQATVGKRICGIVVTDMAGKRLSFGKASGRYLSIALSFITFGIGFLMCGWTRKRQCLHDIVAGCLVLRNSKNNASRK